MGLMTFGYDNLQIGYKRFFVTIIHISAWIPMYDCVFVM